jgi:hypothetical protein
MVKIGMNKINSWILNVMLISILLLSGVLVYWLSAPYEVLTVQEGNYTLDKTEYKRGEVLAIRLRVCKQIAKCDKVYGRFIDGVIFTIPDKKSDFAIGCYDTYLTSVTIPETLPEGNYVYEERIVYEVNPLRDVEYVFTTPEFRVVE